MASRSILDLPAEILRKIVKDNLITCPCRCKDPDIACTCPKMPDVLRYLPKTCRLFHRIFQPLLYSQVWLYPTEAKHDSKSDPRNNFWRKFHRRRIELLERTLTENPALSQDVHRVLVRWAECNTNVHAHKEKFLSTLGLFPYVKHLQIEPPEFLVRDYPGKSTLSWMNADRSPLQNLESLSLRTASVDNEISDFFFLPEIREIELDQLVVMADTGVNDETPFEWPKGIVPGSSPITRLKITNSLNYGQIGEVLTWPRALQSLTIHSPKEWGSTSSFCEELTSQHISVFNGLFLVESLRKYLEDLTFILIPTSFRNEDEWIAPKLKPEERLNLSAFQSLRNVTISVECLMDSNDTGVDLTDTKQERRKSVIGLLPRKLETLCIVMRAPSFLTTGDESKPASKWQRPLRTFSSRPSWLQALANAKLTEQLPSLRSIHVTEEDSNWKTASVSTPQIYRRMFRRAEIEIKFTGRGKPKFKDWDGTCPKGSPMRRR